MDYLKESKEILLTLLDKWVVDPEKPFTKEDKDAVERWVDLFVAGIIQAIKNDNEEVERIKKLRD